MADVRVQQAYTVNLGSMYFLLTVMGSYEGLLGRAATLPALD